MATATPRTGRSSYRARSTVRRVASRPCTTRLDACSLILTDETVERRFGAGMEDAALQRYVDKCRSGFGDGVAEPGIHHRDLLERLRKWPEWEEIAAPQIEFFFESIPVVTDLLGEIPPDWLNERRKHLIRRLLEARVMMRRGFAS